MIDSHPPPPPSGHGLREREEEERGRESDILSWDVEEASGLSIVEASTRCPLLQPLLRDLLASSLILLFSAGIPTFFHRHINQSRAQSIKQHVVSVTELVC